jgi:FAD/FMN-containing dehydrogenase
MYATLTLPAGYDPTSLQRAPTVRVRSADDLRSALRHARERAVTLDGSGMDRVLRFDATRGILELQAATPWTELARYLAQRDISIGSYARTPGLPATVGEAVSQATAGPDGGPVSAHLAAIALFTPEGDLKRADREANGDLFRLAVGGHGVIGLLYSVTLSVESLQRSAAAAAEPVALRLAEGPSTAAPECAIECLVPPAALDAYLREVRSLLEERRTAVHCITVRRYRPDQDACLRWATQEWAGIEMRFGSRNTLGASVAAAEVRRALLKLALAHGGSFPIRDLRDATRSQLEACYPMIAAFLADKRRSDPADRLQNAWYRRLAATMRSEPCAVRWEKRRGAALLPSGA